MLMSGNKIEFSVGQPYIATLLIIMIISQFYEFYNHIC